MYGLDRTIVPDYSKIKNQEILSQALAKLYSYFKRSSRLRVFRDIIGSLDTRFVKILSRKARTIELLELLDKRTQLGECRGGSHTGTKITQHKQTLAKSNLLAIQKKTLNKNSFKSSCNIFERLRLLFAQTSAKNG